MNFGNHSLSRRDFLTAGAVFATLPWLPKAAFAEDGLQRAPEGSDISKVRIYPAIGICRVGGSSQWFYAPEVPGLPPNPNGGFKDSEGRIKRQAQRFRVYGFDDQDRVVGEVTGDAIEWSVHLANTKAAWYGFNNPLDNGEDAPGIPGARRNQHFVTREQREKMLVIDAGERKITGASKKGTSLSGKFWDRTEVSLGHLETDAEGRLVVVPAEGRSHSPVGAGITSFADNDGWHDDWADGPVKATVTLADGRTLEADPSWVACVGPNFAPEIPPISTLHDVIEDLNVSQGWSSKSKGPLSFRRDIYPTFRRVALMVWLTDSARLREGWLDVGDFDDPKFLQQLADPSAKNLEFRQRVFKHFRNPYNSGPHAFKEERLKIPYMLGDGINFDGSSLQWFQFPKLQYDRLRDWAQGKFVNDFKDKKADAISKLEDYPLEQQPKVLTKAALEPCSGGAFHPGVELTYYLRLAPMYARNTDPKAEPFRIAHGSRPTLTQEVGRLLTPEAAFKDGPDGAPIGPQMPGDLTRWMGLPWQCDAFSCQQVILQENFPTAVWWPALLPVDILPEEHYRQILRTDLSREERSKFFHSRVAWSRDVAGIGYHANSSYWDGITNMIELWERMGFVVKRPGPKDADRPPYIPSEVFVESERAPNMERRFDWNPEDGTLPL